MPKSRLYPNFLLGNRQIYYCLAAIPPPQFYLTSTNFKVVLLFQPLFAPSLTETRHPPRISQIYPQVITIFQNLTWPTCRDYKQNFTSHILSYHYFTPIYITIIQTLGPISVYSYLYKTFLIIDDSGTHLAF